ncbi:MAG: bifunctional adenosylcobinamide kinase/adenosylcobinamide-phosphate guanylyltransferase [Halanaerobiaceae bacterium]
MITLILGGARSGKSRFAEKMARYYGKDDVVYIATAEIRDDEMKERIRKHQFSRPDCWQTIEAPYRAAEEIGNLNKKQVILLDCMTVLVSNILMKGRDADEKEKDFNFPGREEEIVGVVASILETARKLELNLIIVSNQVGNGLIPVYKSGRDYRDIIGRVNQLIAEKADKVYLCTAGLPIEIKQEGIENLNKYGL